MLLQKKINHSEVGFSLIEVMIATVIFLIGVSTAMLVSGQSARVQANANRIEGATRLADFAIQRLQPYITASCPGSALNAEDLAADVQVGNAPMCTGTDVNVPPAGTVVSCAPDYPRTGADLIHVFGEDTNSAVGQFFSLPAPAETDLANLGVSYQGTSYRIVWNVVCNYPSPGVKSVAIVVGWGAPTTMWDNEDRVVYKTFSKYQGGI